MEAVCRGKKASLNWDWLCIRALYGKLWKSKWKWFKSKALICTITVDWCMLHLNIFWNNCSMTLYYNIQLHTIQTNVCLILQLRCKKCKVVCYENRPPLWLCKCILIFNFTIVVENMNWKQTSTLADSDNAADASLATFINFYQRYCILNRLWIYTGAGHKLLPTPRIALFVRWLVRPLVTKFQLHPIWCVRRGLSACRAQRTKSRWPEGPPTRSWGPEGPLTSST